MIGLLSVGLFTQWHGQGNRALPSMKSSWRVRAVMIETPRYDGRSAADELFLSGFPPKLQIPIALVDNHDPGFVERGGAQFEDNFGHFLAVSARDLGAAGPNILDEDGKGYAQARLPDGVHLIDVGAFADQEFNEVRQSLIGRPVQRGPAVLSGGIHVDSVLHQELCRLDRRRPFFERSCILYARAGPGRQ